LPPGSALEFSGLMAMRTSVPPGETPGSTAGGTPRRYGADELFPFRPAHLAEVIMNIIADNGNGQAIGQDRNYLKLLHPENKGF